MVVEVENPIEPVPSDGKASNDKKSSSPDSLSHQPHQGHEQEAVKKRPEENPIPQEARQEQLLESKEEPAVPDRKSVV